MPLKKAAPSPSFRRFCFLIFPLVCLVVLFIYQVDEFALRTKTVVGHNLEPTPWHLFQPSAFSGQTRYARVSKILQCSYLKCRRRRSSIQMPESGPGKSSNRGGKCPGFFSRIAHDLKPWVHSGISLSSVMEAQKFAAFRAVIVGGKLYVDFYYACVQSRAMFTVWGLLQLLRRYPGMVPDVDLMFDCMDKPTISRKENEQKPLPLFRYCTTKDHFDIPFPDWSFWGWPEVNIGPWDEEFSSIKQGSHLLNWTQKLNYAYWKGNPDVQSPVRIDLLQCNNTELFGAQIMRQDWVEEGKHGFKESKLSNQCNNRYKIYAEGYAWSVSLKYILACDSLALIIAPEYEDFFSHGLIAMKNYWPISRLDICPSIKSAVSWGNTHPSEAEVIGKHGQKLMERMNMARVYDYMYLLLTEYSKLLRFKPVPPPNALEMCEESLLCYAEPMQRQFLIGSTTSPSPIRPCALQPKPLKTKSTMVKSVKPGRTRV